MNEPGSVAATLAPDPLRFDDGTEVAPASWPRRRRELARVILPHEYGGMPPAPDGVEVIRRSANLIGPEREVAYHVYEIRASVAGGEIRFPLSLWIPPGDGPFPVILDGDGCWRYFNDEAVRSVLERGYIAASFDRTALAADNPDRYRETGLYRLMPGADCGALAAWAWGYHRCVDALGRIDAAEAERIAVTGHSRGGKSALLAGATDERIALTNPNGSGAGGSGPNQMKGEGAEVIEDFLKSRYIFWFGRDFADYAGRDAELPYDQHFLHGAGRAAGAAGHRGVRRSVGQPLRVLRRAAHHRTGLPHARGRARHRLGVSPGRPRPLRGRLRGPPGLRRPVAPRAPRRTERATPALRRRGFLTGPTR